VTGTTDSFVGFVAPSMPRLENAPGVHPDKICNQRQQSSEIVTGSLTTVIANRSRNLEFLLHSGRGVQ